jgi:hypothetical protein
VSSAKFGHGSDTPVVLSDLSIDRLLTERLESFDGREVRANEESVGWELVANVVRLVDG